MATTSNLLARSRIKIAESAQPAVNTRRFNLKQKYFNGIPKAVHACATSNSRTAICNAISNFIQYFMIAMFASSLYFIQQLYDFRTNQPGRPGSAGVSPAHGLDWQG
jgi:hypothetical protein